MVKHLAGLAAVGVTGLPLFGARPERLDNLLAIMPPATAQAAAAQGALTGFTGAGIWRERIMTATKPPSASCSVPTATIVSKPNHKVSRC